MSRLTRAVVVVAACLAAGPPSIAVAGNGTRPNEPAPEEPVIGAEVSTDDTLVPGTPGSSEPVSVPCTWRSVPATEADADLWNQVYEVVAIVINIVLDGDFVVQVTFYSEDGVLHRWNDRTGRYEYQVVADCDAATDPGTWSTGDVDWWVATDPDPAILLPGARAAATRPIVPPTPDLNPPAQGVVRLGMWLAVEPAGPISVEARLGPSVWARTTATLVSTTFDPGNGDAPIVCDGFGTPIPDEALGSARQGPCGYTFTEPVAAGAFTITATWAVTWELSDTRTGRDPDIVVTTRVPYDVVEIQTVGIGG